MNGSAGDPVTAGVETRLAVMDTKLDALLNQRDDHETRIRRLERWVWIATGAAAAIGSAVGSFVGNLPTP